MALAKTEISILDDLLRRRPELLSCKKSLLALHQHLVKCYDHGGKLILCGNGGSFADAIHIAGELAKSFERKRPLDNKIKKNLRKLPFGEELSMYLEAPLTATPLGVNGSLKTAIENDIPVDNIAFAQEALSIIRENDILLGISTSGNAKNVRMAFSVAKALKVTTVALTGPIGGEMAKFADISIKAPGESVKCIQESHTALYHATCSMIEAHYFPEPRTPSVVCV
jgi:D-sedoheptulose 7-phosphate isomerase